MKLIFSVCFLFVCIEIYADGMRSNYINIFNNIFSRDKCEDGVIDLNDDFVKISLKLNEDYISKTDILVLEQLKLFEKCVKENSLPKICHIQTNKNKLIVSLKDYKSCKHKKKSDLVEEACFLETPKKEKKIELSKNVEEQLQLALRVAWGKFYSAQHGGTKNDISSRLYSISELNRLMKSLEKYYDHNNLYSSKFTKEKSQLMFDGLRTQQQSSSILLSSKHNKEEEKQLENSDIFSEKKPDVDSVNKPSILKKENIPISVIKPSEDVAHSSFLTYMDPFMGECAKKEDSILNEKMVTRLNLNWNNFFNLTTVYNYNKENKLITAIDKATGDVNKISQTNPDFANNLDEDATQRYAVSAFLFKHQDAHCGNILIDEDPVTKKYIPRSIDHGRELSPDPGNSKAMQFRTSCFSDWPALRKDLNKNIKDFIKKLDPRDQFNFFKKVALSEYDSYDPCYDQLERLIEKKARHFMANIITLKEMVKYNELNSPKKSLYDLISFSRMIPRKETLVESLVYYKLNNLWNLNAPLPCEINGMNSFIPTEMNDQWTSIYNYTNYNSLNSEIFVNNFTSNIALSFKNLNPVYHSPYRNFNDALYDYSSYSFSYSYLSPLLTNYINAYYPYADPAYKNQLFHYQLSQMYNNITADLDYIINRCEKANYL